VMSCCLLVGLLLLGTLPVGMSLMVDTLWAGLALCMVSRGHFSLDKPCTTWYYNNSDDDKRG
jgi:hypothetical protein